MGKREYEVEKIINSKIVKGVTYYLIKWKNFSKRYNTWEPENNLYCPLILKEFKD